MRGRPADSPVCARPRAALSFSALSERGRTTMLNGLNGLVDVDKGIISREIFVNEEIYRREQEQIFARAWLFIRHEKHIPRPRDLLLSSLGRGAGIPLRQPTG